MIGDIPFSERCVEVNSGYSLIWPYRNIPRGSGPYELHLDNNALIRATWISELPEWMRNRVVISVFHAVSEQWLSNDQFRTNASERIDHFLTPFAEVGCVFDSDFAKITEKRLKSNEAASRTQWMLTYLYVVLLYRILFAQKSDTRAASLLSELKNIDVPVFAGCVMLCCIADYLKYNQSVKLLGDSDPAYSYLSSFLSLHTKAKSESAMDGRYLRNRAGDLSFWLMIPMLGHNNYRVAGEQVAVTQDKALKKLIFRCIPCVQNSNGAMSFSFDERSFEKKHSDEILKRITENLWSPKTPNSRAEQLNRLENLRTHVVTGADPILVYAVHQAWQEWLEPGFFTSFSTKN